MGEVLLYGWDCGSGRDFPGRTLHWRTLAGDLDAGKLGTRHLRGFHQQHLALVVRQVRPRFATGADDFGLQSRESLWNESAPGSGGHRN